MDFQYEFLDDNSEERIGTGHKAYYLKCDYCGYYNLINSENLIWCNNCKQKILRNYPAWKKQNENCSFEDFLKSSLVTDEAEVAHEDKIAHNEDTPLKRKIACAIHLLITLLNVSVILFFFYHIPAGYEMGGILVGMCQIIFGVIILIISNALLLFSFAKTRSNIFGFIVGLLSVLVSAWIEFVITYST